MGTVFNAERTYGVEIETITSLSRNQIAEAINAKFVAKGIEASAFDATYSHDDNSANVWKVVYDGSVSRGSEVVSPILKGFEGKAQIDAVCEALREAGCTTSRATGLHVHHDAADLTPKQIGMAFGTYAAFQTLLDMSVSSSRRNNGYSRRVPVSVTDNGNDKWDDVTTRTAALRKLNSLKGSTRYSAMNHDSMNPRSSQYHGTIEFRQHQGTLNGSKIWAWVLVSQSIIERTVQGAPRFPKTIALEMREGKDHRRGDFIRFKTFIGVLPKRNGYNTETTRPYCEAFRYLYKNIKKFSQAAGIDPTNIGK